MTDYRLIHFNCARPKDNFSPDNEFIKVFISVLPRIFSDGDAYEHLHWHMHGIRQQDGTWKDIDKVFPHDPKLPTPDICTMGGWSSLEGMREFVYTGRTHPPGMRRLQEQLDRSDGASFVMWWAPREARFTIQDGWDKLVQLRENGPTPEAFDMKTATPPPSVLA
jgi:hypothetical protein